MNSTFGEERPRDQRDQAVNRLARYKMLPGTGILVTGKSNGPARKARTRWESIRYAMDGLVEAWLTQPNLRLHVWFGLMVTIAGVWAGLSLAEWLWITVSVGLVIIAELLNTAIERMVDLVVGQTLDPMARSIKDLSAGFVLAACLLAVAIGMFVFAPHVIPR